ncbi:NF038396 family protein [Nesterenkonia halotolerans]|uniref:NF038396 family protein n=1 Tax=Nesterenkonia halotolerans TaxID=225325 RepID=UPI003EE5265B
MAENLRTDHAHGTAGAKGTSGAPSSVVLGMVGYVIFPILALVTVALGFILVLNERLVPGLIFILIIAQVWVIGGLWAHFRRRRLLAPGSGAERL